MTTETSQSLSDLALLFERIRAELTPEQTQRLQQATEQLPDK